MALRQRASRRDIKVPSVRTVGRVYIHTEVASDETRRGWLDAMWPQYKTGWQVAGLILRTPPAIALAPCHACRTDVDAGRARPP
jgi:hypothetical protein